MIPRALRSTVLTVAAVPAIVAASGAIRGDAPFGDRRSPGKMVAEVDDGHTGFFMMDPRLGDGTRMSGSGSLEVLVHEPTGQVRHVLFSSGGSL